jgi:hypothetical protein
MHRYLHGQVFDSGVPRNGTEGGFLASFKPPAEATNIPLRTRPTFAANGETSPINVMTCCGAKGDGVTVR